MSLHDASGQEINSIFLLTEELFYRCMNKFQDFVISFNYEGYLTLFDLRQPKAVFNTQVAKFNGALDVG